MKTALYLVIPVLLLLPACARHAGQQQEPLEIAETAYSEGRYSTAQNIADSIMLGTTFGKLNVSELCRLSLLFIRLGEKSNDEQGNTAMATRALVAAYGLDSDSTSIYLHNVPVDDRARMAIVNALSNAQAKGDSIIEEPDSLLY